MTRFIILTRLTENKRDHKSHKYKTFGWLKMMILLLSLFPAKKTKCVKKHDSFFKSNSTFGPLANLPKNPKASDEAIFTKYLFLGVWSPGKLYVFLQKFRESSPGKFHMFLRRMSRNFPLLRFLLSFC